MTSDNALPGGRQTSGTTSDNAVPSRTGPVARDYQYRRECSARCEVLAAEAVRERDRAESGRLYAEARQHATTTARS